MGRNTIFLVNPSEQGILENAGDRIPWGLLSIASKLKHLGYRPKVFDLNHVDREELIGEAYREKPLAIGISVYTSPMFSQSVDLADNLRDATNRLIAGGYHASFMPESLLEEGFDSVVVGEGEEAILEALDRKGVIRAPVLDLTRQPRTNTEFLDLRKYGINGSQATLITSRGCPYSCAFCGNLEHRVRYEPLDNVQNLLQRVGKANFKSLYFLDDVFTLDRNRMRSVLSMVRLPFRVTTRANLLDEGKLDDLESAGCEWLSMGIESGNDDILRRANKGMTTDDNYRAVNEAHKRGINTKGFFIIGLPGETEGSARETIRFSQTLKRAGLTSADFYYLIPFPGTPIAKDPAKYGLTIKDTDWRNYLQAGKTAKCVVETEHLSAERIEALVKEARRLWHG